MTIYAKVSGQPGVFEFNMQATMSVSTVHPFLEHGR